MSKCRWESGRFLPCIHMKNSRQSHFLLEKIEMENPPTLNGEELEFCPFCGGYIKRPEDKPGVQYFYCDGCKDFCEGESNKIRLSIIDGDRTPMPMARTKQQLCLTCAGKAIGEFKEFIARSEMFEEILR